MAQTQLNFCFRIVAPACDADAWLVIAREGTKRIAKFAQLFEIRIVRLEGFRTAHHVDGNVMRFVIASRKVNDAAFDFLSFPGTGHERWCCNDECLRRNEFSVNDMIAEILRGMQ